MKLLECSKEEIIHGWNSCIGVLSVLMQRSNMV